MSLKISDIILDSLTADPTSPPNGALWFRSDINEWRFRKNGQTKKIAAKNSGADDADVPKCKHDATVAPTATDDSSADFEVGSCWVDVTADKAYFCVDATATAAVWIEITQAGGGLAATDIDTLAELNAIITDATLIDTTDARLSDARTPTAHTHVAADVTDFDTEVSNNASVAANTAKTGITAQQASDITTNNAKVSNIAEVDATTTVKGIVEKSTSAENVAGTSDLVYPTVAGTKEMIDTHASGGSAITVEDEGTPLTTDVKKLNFAGAGVTVTEPVADEMLITIAGGGGGASDLAVVQARRTTAYTCTGSFVSLTLDATDTENDAAVVKHNDTTTSRIDILENGLYELFYDITIHGTSDSRTTQTRIYKNGTTLVTGSDMSILSDGATNTDTPISMDRKVVASLVNGDYIEVQITDTSSVEVNAGASFIVTKLEGVQGATGIAGADGDITWEGNWVSQQYTTNQAVKYTDGNSYVCKLNTVSSEVPTNATYWDILAEKGDTGAAGTGQSRVDISVHPHNDWKKGTASATYIVQAGFLFGGSTLLGTPSKIYVNSWQEAAGSGKVRIYDKTNSLVICESASITSTSEGNIVDLGTISNVPTGQAVFTIENKGDGTNINNIASVSIEF